MPRSAIVRRICSRPWRAGRWRWVTCTSAPWATCIRCSSCRRALPRGDAGAGEAPHRGGTPRVRARARRLQPEAALSVAVAAGRPLGEEARDEHGGRARPAHPRSRCQWRGHLSRGRRAAGSDLLRGRAATPQERRDRRCALLGDGGAGQRLWEYLNQFTAINYSMTMSMVTMNLDAWKGLSPELQKAVLDAAQAT